MHFSLISQQLAQKMGKRCINGTPGNCPSSEKDGSETFPLPFGIKPQQRPLPLPIYKHTQQKYQTINEWVVQRQVTKKSNSCSTKLDGWVLPRCFAITVTLCKISSISYK